MTEQIPPLEQSNYILRNPDVIGRRRARTEKFKSSFYPSCLTEWTELDPEIRLAPSVTVFKKKLLSIIRPLQNLFSGFMTQWDYHTLLSLEWVSIIKGSLIYFASWKAPI